MKVDLDRDDLVNLLKGYSPLKNQLKLDFVRENGSINPSYGKWYWNYDCFNTNTEEDLWEFYLILKMSK